MKYFILLIIFYTSNYCISQTSSWNMKFGLGISGINRVIENQVEFDNHLKFNKKNNVLDNKFRNNILHSGYLSLSKMITKGFMQNYKINVTAAVYTFSSVFYKEEQFPVTLYKNDTINTPNWLTPKYNLPFIELGLSREINLDNKLNIDIGFFISYMVELYGTSQVILFDSAYFQWSRQTFTFNKEYPNNEFDQINYGLRGVLHLFPLKQIHPTIMFTQGLNDISLKSFNVNQHANIWALHIGLSYNFNHKRNKINNEIKND